MARFTQSGLTILTEHRSPVVGIAQPSSAATQLGFWCFQMTGRTAEISAWPDVESEIHRPTRWLGFAAGAFVLVITLFVAWAPGPSHAIPVWVAWTCIVFGVLFGGALMGQAIVGMLRPDRLRHAAPHILPSVPSEPVIWQGSVVHGRVTHELMEESDGWHYRPAANLWRNDKRLLFGFAIPFSVIFAGILSWFAHDQCNLGWIVAILFAAAVTLITGGSTFCLIGMLMRAGYRRLCSLVIPRNGGDVELDLPEEAGLAEADLATGLKWAFQGETRRRRLTIPCNLVEAVQLCPWKFAAASDITWSDITWAVQGLLVLASPTEGKHERLPILLTSDFVGAARLMQGLARTLRVPFLFSADAEGWKAEETRAKKRPPLRVGGTVS